MNKIVPLDPLAHTRPDIDWSIIVAILWLVFYWIMAVLTHKTLLAGNFRIAQKTSVLFFLAIGSAVPFIFVAWLCVSFNYRMQGEVLAYFGVLLSIPLVLTYIGFAFYLPAWFFLAARWVQRNMRSDDISNLRIRQAGAVIATGLTLLWWGFGALPAGKALLRMIFWDNPSFPR